MTNCEILFLFENESVLKNIYARMMQNYIILPSINFE